MGRAFGATGVRVADAVAAIAPRLSTGSRISTAEYNLTAFAFDAWPVSAKRRQLGRTNTCPDLVVSVSTTSDVAAVLRWAHDNRVPVVPWGLGSSVVGGPLLTSGGITVDMSQMNRILAVDDENLVVRVEAGACGGAVEAELRSRSLTLGHSPQSLHRSTVGGWIATRATGQFSSRYGGIEDLCVSIEMVLPDGRVVETRECPRMAVGPDLKHLFIGAEGCFGIATRATLKIFPMAERQLFETIDFPTVSHGVRAMRSIMASGLRPFLLRLYDLDEARHAMIDHSYGNPMMFLGCEGHSAVAAAEMEACLEACRSQGGIPKGPAGAKAWMERRFDFSHIESVLDRPGGVAETIEVSHDWTGIMPTYEALRRRLKPFATELLGHFSHAYTNGVSLYVILIDEADDAAAAERRLLSIWDAAMETALKTGASISHHHSTGLARTRYVGRALGSGMSVLEGLKDAFDPHAIMNPGKLGLSPERTRRGTAETP